MSKKEIIEYYCYCLEVCSWQMADKVVKEMKKEIDSLRHHTTATVSQLKLRNVADVV
jgi:hypothetical protein